MKYVINIFSTIADTNIYISCRIQELCNFVPIFIFITGAIIFYYTIKEIFIELYVLA